MVLFELLLVGLVFITVCGLIALLVSAGTKHTLIARQIASFLAIAWSLYFAVLFAVAALTRPRVYAMNEQECFNDVCFAVRNASRGGTRLTVALHEENRSRGTPEGVPGLRARIWDGRQYYSPENNADFGKVLKSGESADASLVFDIPEGVMPVGLVLDRGFTPRYLVIGESPLFHKPSLLRLD